MPPKAIEKGSASAWKGEGKGREGKGKGRKREIKSSMIGTKQNVR